MEWVSKARSDAQLGERTWRLSWWAFTVVVAPLLWFSPPLLSALMAFSLVVKWLCWRVHRDNWARALILLIVPLSFAAIYMNFRQVGLTLSLVSCLMVLAVAKFLETQHHRDAQMLCMANLSLLMAMLMYSQSMLLFFWIVLGLIMTLRTMWQLAQGECQLPVSPLRELGRLMGVALPIAAALFVFFPRLPQLWGVGQVRNQAITGLPESMRMGDLASLAQSNEVAFRVAFAESIPAQSALYWRGPVLWQFDGENWQQDLRNRELAAPVLEVSDNALIDYRFTPVKPSLEWLLPLDRPVVVPQGVRLGRSFQVPVPRKNKQSAYVFSSAPDARLTELNARERQLALQLPAEFHAPKTQTLMQRFYEQGNERVSGFAQAFMQHIRDEAFFYSLEPPAGMGDVERFLFDGGRVGFCEHYAHAMAVGARLVGVPSRVVIGYQGGELNTLTGEWLVREESAHAWVELYDETEGWIRFDPTAAVAPERVAQGRLSAQTLSAGDDKRAIGTRWAEQFRAIAWLRGVNASAQIWWQDWVVGLDNQRQQSLLERLGLKGSSMAVVFAWVLAAVLVMVVLGWWGYWAWRNRQGDALTREAEKVLAFWKKRGEIRRNQESVAVFLRRLAEGQSAQTAQALFDAAKAYENVRYGRNGDSAALLRRVALQRLRLARKG